MMERLQHMDVAHRRAGRPGINYAQGSWTIVETAVEARAGFRDRPTTVVLIVSTTLTIALFAAIYIGFFSLGKPDSSWHGAYP
jgi:hypothetical protein